MVTKCIKPISHWLEQLSPALQYSAHAGCWSGFAGQSSMIVYAAATNKIQIVCSSRINTHLPILCARKGIFIWLFKIMLHCENSPAFGNQYNIRRAIEMHWSRSVKSSFIKILSQLSVYACWTSHFSRFIGLNYFLFVHLKSFIFATPVDSYEKFITPQCIATACMHKTYSIFDSVRHLLHRHY